VGMEENVKDQLVDKVSNAEVLHKVQENKSILDTVQHTCNDNAGIRRRKQQKVVYRIFTCIFSVSSLQCHDLLTL